MIHASRVGDCLLWEGQSWGGGFRLYTQEKYPPVEPSIAAWIVWRGEIQAGRLIVRTCGHRRCIEPSHLDAMTPKDVRATFPVRNPLCGIDHPAHKVTGCQVYAARMRYAAGASTRQVGRQLGITRRAAWLIIAGKRWAHIKGPVGVRSKKEAAALRYGKAA